MALRRGATSAQARPSLQRLEGFRVLLLAGPVGAASDMAVRTCQAGGRQPAAGSHLASRAPSHRPQGCRLGYPGRRGPAGGACGALPLRVGHQAAPTCGTARRRKGRGVSTRRPPNPPNAEATKMVKGGRDVRGARWRSGVAALTRRLPLSTILAASCGGNRAKWGSRVSPSLNPAVFGCVRGCWGWPAG